MNFTLGLDLGGTSIKAVTVTPEGRLLAQQNVSFVDKDMEWAVKARAVVQQLQTSWAGSTSIMGFVPRVVEKQLVERFITQLSS